LGKVSQITPDVIYPDFRGIDYGNIGYKALLEANTMMRIDQNSIKDIIREQKPFGAE
jgi:hypothetical protein